MELRGLLLVLFTIILIPLLLLSASQDAYFILMGLVLIITSIRNVKVILFRSKLSEDKRLKEDKSNETIEDLEASLNININRFKIGLNIAKCMVIILFFIYCSFFLRSIFYDIPISIIILYWINNIFNIAKRGINKLEIRTANRYELVTFLFINSLSICITIMAAYSKFSNFFF